MILNVENYNPPRQNEFEAKIQALEYETKIMQEANDMLKQSRDFWKARYRNLKRFIAEVENVTSKNFED